MATDDFVESINVPTLNSVIEFGDESVIQTKRISAQLGQQLDTNLGPALSREIIDALAAHSDEPVGSQVLGESAQSHENLTDSEASLQEQNSDPDEALELMIDDVVDRHITALRKDIRALLERATGKD